MGVHGVDLERDVWADLDAKTEKSKHMQKIISLCVVSILLISSGAFAQTTVPSDASTAAMVELCQDLRDQEAQNFCFGFGEGVYQAYLAGRPPNSKSAICFPHQNHSREQTLKEFLVWNKKNPQYGKDSAAKTLIRFFSQQYPCKSAK